MRGDLKGFIKVTYYEKEHTGHGEDALPRHQRQRTLSDEIRQYVDLALSWGLSPPDILSKVRERIIAEWHTREDCRRSGLVSRCCPPAASTLDSISTTLRISA